MDLGRVLEVIHSIDADVLALQEVEWYQGLKPDFLKLLAKNTDYHITPGPALRRPDSDYGNALLTRQPVVSVSLEDISIPGYEPRGAIMASLDDGEAGVLVAATHLGRRAAERRRQVAVILHHMEALAASNGPARQVLMGDTNEWLPFSARLRVLNSRLGHPPAVATYPSRLPLLALDRIWIHPPPASLSLHAHSEKGARVASDHLPLIADYS